ncbi:ABC transporter substrate-binding protein [Lutispora thermophila]|uniref:Spermidine/putrescine transport system substrate-binding protein n=1 Tax=Lutispora thermophila DSM 19022 TaxID=1122184 RepID=A0A1M6FEG6_9FIRM|nr:ABC transporter substrate-binding protein [Lutispora thermophila]SHI96043.1 spermidine/putrescine transport system substrate-binding protein [Lutispora thermophila DSM 19022]
MSIGKTLKRIIAAILVLSMMMALTACGGGKEQGSNQENNTSEGEKTKLVVVNWKDYGSDDPRVIKYFEQQYNCEIVHEYMASEEELLTKLRTGGLGKYDVVLPNASILPVAIDEGLFEEVDTSKLENYQYIFDKFSTLPENKKDGKIYAVPWVWGSTAIAYNNELVDEEIDSINVLWDEKYKGMIAFRDDFNDAIMTAAIALGQDPSNPSDLNAIKQKLIEQKPLNRTYWKTGDEWSKLFANKQIAVGMMWSGQAATMKKAGEPVTFVVPKEGAIGWVDYWGVVKDAPNKDMAYKFIDYMISKEFQLQWTVSGGPAPVNSEAVNALDKETINEMNIGEDSLNKLYFIEYHGEDVKKQWNELWQEVKAQ